MFKMLGAMIRRVANNGGSPTNSVFKTSLQERFITADGKVIRTRKQ